MRKAAGKVAPLEVVRERLEAARLANYAGGIVVMKHATAAVTADELLAAVREEAQR